LGMSFLQVSKLPKVWQNFNFPYGLLSVLVYLHFGPHVLVISTTQLFTFYYSYTLRIYFNKAP
jgi:hypothetical protein